MSYRLQRSESAADGVRRVVVERLDDAVGQLREKLDSDPVDAVHSARKDIKKARSALRLVRAELGEKRYREENDRLRGAGLRLSDARDAAVRAGTLEALREASSKEQLEGVAGKALADAIAASPAADDRADAALAAAAATAADELERARDSAAGWSFDRGGWRLLAPGLDRAYRRGRLESRAVAADPTDEGVHAWRKRAKDLWYQLRLLNPAWPAVIGALADEVHELTDLLGDHHDLALLAADLDGTELSLTNEERAALAELVRRRQAALLAAALALGEQIYAERPKAYLGRMRAYWRAWRD